MFDHRRSELVDVFPNAEGEFIQVWDSPRGTQGRRLLLTYLRTSEGPREICHRLFQSEGPFELIEVTDLQRVFHYRKGGEPRHERFLTSGRVLVHDPRHGIRTRRVFTADFDWVKQAPKGKSLADKAVMRLQSGDESWYVST